MGPRLYTSSESANTFALHIIQRFAALMLRCQGQRAQRGQAVQAPAWPRGLCDPKFRSPPST